MLQSRPGLKSLSGLLALSERSTLRLRPMPHRRTTYSSSSSSSSSIQYSDRPVSMRLSQHDRGVTSLVVSSKLDTLWIRNSLKNNSQ